jgi:hypothetical protein
MKKNTLFAFVLLIVLIIFSFPVMAACEGDLNCDGVVDEIDLAIWADCYGNTECPKCIVAPIPKTGQTESFPSTDFDDGALQKGVGWPDPRFTDNGDGTVTDHLTGLIWLKNADCFPAMSPYSDALEACNSLADGQCGLNDGSVPGDWRLPNLKELHSLTDFGRINPALPSNHPFTEVHSYAYTYYITSTISPPNRAIFCIDMYRGSINRLSLDYYSFHAWPVRGGN